MRCIILVLLIFFTTEFTSPVHCEEMDLDAISFEFKEKMMSFFSPKSLAKTINKRFSLIELFNKTGIETNDNEWAENAFSEILNHTFTYIDNRTDIINVFQHCLDGDCGDISKFIDTSLVQFVENQDTKAILAKLRLEATLRKYSNMKLSELLKQDLNLKPSPAIHTLKTHGTRPVADVDPQLSRHTLAIETTTITMIAIILAWDHGYAARDEAVQFWSKLDPLDDVKRQLEFEWHQTLPKWKVVRTLFPTFDRWYAVWNSEPLRLREKFGGVKKLCADFLPFILPDFNFHLNAETWRKNVAPSTELSTATPSDPALVSLLDYWKKDDEPNSRLGEIFNDTGHEVPKKDIEKCWDLMDYIFKNEEKLELLSKHYYENCDTFTFDIDFAKGAQGLGWKIWEGLKNFGKILYKIFIYPLNCIFSVWISRIILYIIFGIFSMWTSANYFRNVEVHSRIGERDFETFSQNSIWDCPIIQKQICFRECQDKIQRDDFRWRKKVVNKNNNNTIETGNECTGASGFYNLLEMAYIDQD